MAIQGTKKSETLLGTAEGEMIAGKGGNDLIFGYLGDDRLYGGNGDDHINGGEGNDRLWGGRGHDTLIGGNGHDWIEGGFGDDVIIAGQNYSVISGGLGNDAMLVCHGAANGGEGDDLIFAREWDDFGWQAVGSTPYPYGPWDIATEPTTIFGGGGADRVDMGFRLGAAGTTVRWLDYQPGEMLSLSIYAEDNTLLYDDATTKALLDTNDDGMLSDADGDGMGLDVSFNPHDGSLSIRVDNDVIALGYSFVNQPPVDHFFI
jgi:hypothetical protein